MRTRRFLSWLAFVLLILIAIACFFFALDLKKTVLTRLSDQGTTIVGQKVLIQDIIFHFPAIVDLYGIVVKNPEGFPSGDLLRIERLHLNIHWSQLLRGHFSLRRLVAFSPDVELIKNEKGEWNVSGPLRQRLLQESPVQTKYRMDELRVESGRFTFNRDPAFTVEGVEAKLMNVLSDPGAKTEVKGNWIYLGNKFQAEALSFFKRHPEGLTFTCLRGTLSCQLSRNISSLTTSKLKRPDGPSMVPFKGARREGSKSDPICSR